VIACAQNGVTQRNRREMSHALARSAHWFVVALLSIAVLPAAARNPGADSPSSPAPAPRVSAVRSGKVPTRDGLLLILAADAGNIRILTDASGEVSYRVIVEAEASDPAAGQRLQQFSLSSRATPAGVALTGQMPGPRDLDRVWVSYEVHVPLHYGLEISTSAGDITTQNVDGPVVLSTGGGNIQAGNIGEVRHGHAPSKLNQWLARLDTAGGHIQVGNVAGSLRASTAGGHITAGNIDGNAILQTGGGHLHVGRVVGTAQLSTGGGDIVAERANDGVTAETGGGRIEFGEAAGAIRARTAGGGVRIDHIAGPTTLDSSDGGIFLAGVQAPLHASTRAGAITASFSPLFGDSAAAAPDPAHAATFSQLASVQGDIIVYLPPKMALTIDALVEHGSDRRIVADPSLPLRVRYENSANGRVLRGQCDFNGGGRVLHLQTASGNIELRLLNPEMERQLADRSRKTTAGDTVSADPAMNGTAYVASGSNPSVAEQQEGADPSVPGRLAALRLMFESFWSSEIPVGPAEQQGRLIHSVAPEYPEIARQAGVEGDVTLRVVIGKDGAVEDVVPISGESVLARAATEAIEQWRYSPELLGGRPIGVVTTVTLAFRLR
jgi:TonB family protein